MEDDRDHIRGPADAKVTLVEYGDFECSYCGQAEPVVRTLLQNMGDLRYVWRHLPLTDVHLNAALSAEAAEAADRQGVLADARPAATASTGVAAGSPGALCRRPRARRRPVPRGLAPLVGAARGGLKTSTRMAPAEWPAPPRSSSTAAANMGPTTSTPSPRRSRRQRLSGSSTCRIVPRSGRRQTG